MTETQIKEMIDHLELVKNEMTRMGVTCEHKRRLMRISNSRFNGHQLVDGVCHYRNSLEFGGNTYNFRHIFKQHNMKWDNDNKVWHGSMKLDATKICEQIVGLA